MHIHTLTFWEGEWTQPVKQNDFKRQNKFKIIIIAVGSELNLSKPIMDIHQRATKLCVFRQIVFLKQHSVFMFFFTPSSVSPQSMWVTPDRMCEQS